MNLCLGTIALNLAVVWRQSSVVDAFTAPLSTGAFPPNYLGNDVWNGNFRRPWQRLQVATHESGSNIRDNEGRDHRKSKEQSPRSSVSEARQRRAWPDKIPLPNDFQAMRLEAIFHQKFENEGQSDASIRHKMQDHVSAGRGYLEVSLKHSGSLVLWSGGPRFYSKNAFSNQYTYIAEILLRQHFYRSFRYDSVGNTKPRSHMSMYNECSSFVEENRLTLAFETVTAVLGDHAESPKRDYLILIAVADRDARKFYTTTETIQFAQLFRLPYNDVWTFSSTEGALEAFKLYETYQDIGSASNIVPVLTKSADAHVSSIYPHIDFQGDLLEGVIIRYVPYAKNENKESIKGLISGLGEVSQNRLASLPPSTPDGFELAREAGEKMQLLTADIRRIYAKVAGDSFSERQEVFRAEIEAIFRDSGVSTRSFVRTSQPKNFPALLSRLTTSKDSETSLIAGLFDHLSKMKKKVRLVLARETFTDSDAEHWICGVHVLHDETFKRFRNSAVEGSLPLYRGLFIELLTSTDGLQGDREDDNPVSFPDYENSDSEFLMLKMKLLPYVVRTFFCRRSINLAAEETLNEAIARLENLFSVWGASDAAYERWKPFLLGWLQYLSLEHWKTDTKLTRPTSFEYLKCLDHYSKLYEARIFPPSRPISKFNAFLLVVALDQKDADRIATRLHKQLEGSIFRDQSTLNDSSKLRGVISGLDIRGFSKVRRLLNQSKDDSILVLHGMDEYNIRTMTGGGESPEYKKLTALSKRLDQLPSNFRIDLPTEVIKDQIVTIPNDVLDKCRSFSESVGQPAPGALIFFPGIPGCGKSAVSEYTRPESILPHLSKDPKINQYLSQPDRELWVESGDRTKQKKGWWKNLAGKWKRNPSCVVIADKNAPPSAWQNVAQVCAAANGTPIPVIPDTNALRTTKIDKVDEANRKISELYPFSLEYLAVCLARVLQRGSGTHDGKLDSGFSMAGLVVVAFFRYYEGITADDFLHSLQLKLDQANTKAAIPIVVPFFKSPVGLKLPEDLKFTLIEVLQHKDAVKKLDKKDKLTMELEKKLRKAISEHSDMLLRSTVDFDESFRAFSVSALESVAALSKSSSSTSTHAPQPRKTRWNENDSSIQLVSIDVPNELILEILRTKKDECEGFLRNAVGDGQLEFSGENFVSKTHVTMAHRQRTSEEEMKEKFEHLQGSNVNVSITGLLWDHRKAALAVRLPKETRDGTALPPSTNDFCHITIWLESGVKAYEASQLSDEHSRGKAQRVDFDKPVTIQGTVSFWGNGNQIIKVK